MSVKLTFENVKKFVLENSECELLSTEYINARQKLVFRCKCGHIFERTFDNFRTDKVKLCKSCSNKRSLSNEAKVKISKSRQKDMNKVIDVIENQMKCKFIKRYTKENSRSTIITFKCPVHGIQEAYWTNLVKRKSCPKCNKMYIQSMLSKEVENWLIDKNIDFIKEYKFKNCIDKRELPFDFYLPGKNICIEVDGIQHYQKVYFGDKDPDEALLYYKKHDEIKTNFCNTNNIKLLRIPYFNENQLHEILMSAII